MKITIQKFEKQSPKPHLTKIKVLVNDRTVITVDDFDCETFSDADRKMKTVFEVAYCLAKATSSEVLVEDRTVSTSNS